MSALYRIRGFRSRKPDAMTNDQRQRKWRRVQGNRRIGFDLTPDLAACVIYLRSEWGMESASEVARASIRFLTLCTRNGLTTLPQSIDD